MRYELASKVVVGCGRIGSGIDVRALQDTNVTTNVTYCEKFLIMFFQPQWNELLLHLFFDVYDILIRIIYEGLC